MANVTKIDIRPTIWMGKKLRVAAYARVSTSDEDQLQSLEAQKEHYENLIKRNPQWDFAGLYYDEGISGTKMEKREDLLRMLSDCETGKIQHIVIKSISRLARNTTDCLEMIRRLNSLGISIYFERENIDTSSMESELILTILSSLAESESTAISQNVKWGIKCRFRNGTYVISDPAYGYKNVNGKMVVVPEEAKIIKEIFAAALSGEGAWLIAQKLQKQGVPTKRGSTWKQSSVLRILQNEMYTGDALFQKTYSDKSFKRHMNDGECDCYIAKDHHEAIISHKTFEKVRQIMQQRGNEKGNGENVEKYQNRYAFSGKIICGCCGSSFKRRKHNKPSGDYIAWTCKTHLLDKNACGMKYITEESVREAFTVMMRKLLHFKKELLVPFVASLRGMDDTKRVQKIQDLESQINQNAKQQTIITQLMNSGYLEQDIFAKEMGQLQGEMAALQEEKSIIARGINGSLIHAGEASKLLRLAENDVSVHNCDDLFSEYVDTVTVLSRTEIVFNLKCGLRLRERLVSK